MDDKTKKEFEEYKRTVEIEDIKTLEKVYKVHWWEWIPVIGAFIYMIRIQVHMAGINRGILRKNIAKIHVILVFSTVFIWHYFLIISSFFMYFIIKKGIEKTKKQLNIE